MEDFFEHDADTERLPLDQMRGLTLPKTADKMPTLTRKAKIDKAMMDQEKQASMKPQNAYGMTVNYLP